jgi:hypothetical protein
MTVREIANVCNCTPETVKNKIREMFPGKMINGKPTMLSQVESIQLVEDMRKKGFVEPMINLQVEPTNILQEPTNTLQDKRIDRLESMVEKLVSVTTALLQSQIKQPEEPKKLMPSIKINPRNTLRQILNDYSAKTGTEYKDAYNGLYNDIYYHLGKNVKLLANRNGIKTIDMIDRIDIEEPGFWNQVLELAKTLYTN